MSNIEMTLGIVVAVWVLVSQIVAVTRTQADDRALSFIRRLAERISMLQPRNSKGMFSLPGAKAKRPDDK